MIAECYLGEPRNLLSFTVGNRIAECVTLIYLGNRIFSMLSLQSFCKTLISDSTYFKLKVSIAECVTLENHEKTFVECRIKEQRRAFSEFAFGVKIKIHVNCPSHLHEALQLS